MMSRRGDKGECPPAASKTGKNDKGSDQIDNHGDRGEGRVVGEGPGGPPDLRGKRSLPGPEAEIFGIQ